MDKSPVRLQFGLMDLILALGFAAIVFGISRSDSLVHFAIGMNVVLIIVFLSKPLMDRLHFGTRLLCFPKTFVEWLVVIMLFAMLN